MYNSYVRVFHACSTRVRFHEFIPRRKLHYLLEPRLFLPSRSKPIFDSRISREYRRRKKEKGARKRKEKRRGFNLRSTIGYLLLSAHSSVKCKSPLVRGWPRICIWRKVVAGNSSLLPRWFRRLSPYIYMYIYRVYLLICIQGGAQKRFAACSSFYPLDIEAGRLDPVFTNRTLFGINKMFWSL